VAPNAATRREAHHQRQELGLNSQEVGLDFAVFEQKEDCSSDFSTLHAELHRYLTETTL
jgi:hypothetical protein